MRDNDEDGGETANAMDLLVPRRNDNTGMNLSFISVFYTKRYADDN